jgi:hypothetical protein
LDGGELAFGSANGRRQRLETVSAPTETAPWGDRALRGGRRVLTYYRVMLVCPAPLIGAGPALGAVVAEVALWPVDDSDLDALFDHWRDPESVRMAAFVTEAQGPAMRLLRLSRWRLRGSRAAHAVLVR